jgi:hypothetical protein
MKFIIDRTKWLRGERDSKLLRSDDGKQCCIGQVCSQLKVDDSRLRDVGTVNSILYYTDGEPDAQKHLLELLEPILQAEVNLPGSSNSRCTRSASDLGSAGETKNPDMHDAAGAIRVKPFELPWVDEAYRINDDPDFDDLTREQKLNELVAPHGHEFEFIN